MVSERTSVRGVVTERSQRPRRELDEHLASTFDEHLALVVPALRRAAAAVADAESNFAGRLTALKDRAERLVFMLSLIHISEPTRPY